MATYAIGDLQGCYSALLRLLDAIQFNPNQDQLWFAGDLVSRGTESLETLRFVKQLCEQKTALTVLGNHDISLIASFYGVRTPHKSLQALITAPDYAELIQWLRRQPLLHYEPSKQAALVHAGIAPQWDLLMAARCAVEVEQELQQPDPSTWLSQMYGDMPDQWSTSFGSDIERQRFSMNVLTRMRYCHSDGRLNFYEKGNPAQIVDKSLIPWFEYPKRQALGSRVIFGHWSTLGYYVSPEVVALDTGCVWSGQLTAFCLETEQHTSVNCNQALNTNS
ncbi:symmetrical bis(5'-nucleosyl)-tetraphosphatase [Thiofilum flexile]|uniref:symmetrical bis(5'-nucleosyl)-tetraphosphatase n=1 Tax=Thiofilum flexile TaxID=125627 RepID=UPI000366493D|nr:symmetrical bis(5'-nucleosyl)-tetraphosphatase [Thiofilum flexile]